ncbi:MAG: hypothetical protein KAG66_04255, partial [Methylococcales bacterium]|nr:hypothetical protein [Methylococcales bacterium]
MDTTEIPVDYRYRRKGFPSLAGNGIIDDRTPVVLIDQLFACFLIAEENQTSNYTHAESQEFGLWESSWGEGSAESVQARLTALFLDYFADVDIEVHQRSNLERDPDLISLEISGQVTSVDGRVTDMTKAFSLNAKSSVAAIASVYDEQRDGR